MPAPTSLLITPYPVSIPVGSSQSFTAVDQNGTRRPDATWSVSDSTVASLAADGTGVLTGVSPGQVTLIGTVQGISAQASVSVIAIATLAPRTVLWTAPPASPGAGCSHTFQAAPTVTGTPDIYCIASDSNSDMIVQALTNQGSVLWQRTVATNAIFSFAVPDAFGGLLVNYLPMPLSEPVSVVTVDVSGLSGSAMWQNTLTSATLGQFAIRQDSSIATVQTTSQLETGVVSSTSSLATLDPNTGQPTTNQSLPTSTV
jgi:hypothetical protein